MKGRLPLQDSLFLASSLCSMDCGVTVCGQEKDIHDLKSIYFVETRLRNTVVLGEA